MKKNECGLQGFQRCAKSTPPCTFTPTLFFLYSFILPNKFIMNGGTSINKKSPRVKKPAQLMYNSGYTRQIRISIWFCWFFGGIMDFNDQLSQHYSEILDGTYECVDRIVLNGYYKQCHHPGGFRIWWRRLKGSDNDLDKNNLMRMAGRFNRRVYAFADHANIPIITCKPKDKKHEIAAEYIPDDKNFSGIFLILKSRATSLVWEVEKAGPKVDPFVKTKNR
jgi:hypothetical protein